MSAIDNNLEAICTALGITMHALVVLNQERIEAEIGGVTIKGYWAGDEIRIDIEEKQK
jgi:hypothetical protein